ncbi:MAG: putative dual-specificity RNA methyltransferase RlmN [Chlamydiia bacterium]|nr:putative dual-specificity RNA methyltransferase RlmN [Chlamydiia bacterium]
MIETEIKKGFCENSLAEWKEFFRSKGKPAFIAEQVVDWIFGKSVHDPDQFRNISLSNRSLLKENFSFELFHIHSRIPSTDGSEKFLLETHDEYYIEMVLMPYESRITLCISSQVGCQMGCTFCQTGKMGLSRNLTRGEILGQIFLANSLLKEQGKRVTNVVFMGMGEPLDNYDEVAAACKMMIAKEGFSMSPHRVTVSTSGVIPAIERLGEEVPVRLAISLHSADQKMRSDMMPINRRYDLDALKEVLLRYPAHPRYGITFEYVLIEGKNDSLLDAKKLVRFLHGLKAKVNLIPINEFPGIDMKKPSSLDTEAFQKYLSSRGIPSPIRYSRAQDVSGGCGQLAAKTADELNMDPRVLAKRRRKAARLASG